MVMQEMLHAQGFCSVRLPTQRKAFFPTSKPQPW